MQASRGTVPLLIAHVLVFVSGAAAQPTASPEKGLNAKSADPTYPLAQVQFLNTLALTNREGEGVANELLLQPVFPIPPLKRFPIGQILRPSIPLATTTPGPDRTTGFGDISLFDIFLPERFSWGAVGVGPVFVFPTASDDRLGAGKWQAGPAAAVLYEAIPHLQLGVIVQNPISFAGDDDREDVNQLIVQPIAQYNFPDGWYASMGDFNWTFDWEDGGAATIPLALQLGRVVKIGRYDYNLSIEGAYTVANDGPAPRWMIRFGFSLLLPE
jgi:hypothetical protein